ncbi:MAG: SIR2 family protein [Candidatus Thiodiazotropha endolucinida]
MNDETQTPAQDEPVFSFLKGKEDAVAPKDGKEFNWDTAAGKVREALSDAMNARNVAFLLGSGCSSFKKEGAELGVPTMAPMAAAYIDKIGEEDDPIYATEAERTLLLERLGLDITREEFSKNLERLMEVLYSFQFSLQRSDNDALSEAKETVDTLIGKVTRYVLKQCTEGLFSYFDESVARLYEAFYRKLIYRDRALPRPWMFTTNYDLFSETAMDRLAIPYCNGFSGTVERRFNPANFRYSLAEQLDITSRKWTAVDSFVYLCKLHGSVNWIEESKGLFPIREIQQPSSSDAERVMIYPTPAKQNASFGSPYSDLFREFQTRVVRDQSVLFIIGYSFGDEHINNIIFQALTIPTFRMIAFLPPDAEGVAAQLRDLDDPRIWMIGGQGPTDDRRAHYFDTFVEKFMPEPPGDKVDTAVAKVLETLVSGGKVGPENGGSDGL